MLGRPAGPGHWPALQIFFRRRRGLCEPSDVLVTCEPGCGISMKRSLKVTSFILLVALCIALAVIGGSNKPKAPVQPIEFSHWQHVKKQEGPELDCIFCHEHADKGPHATIPNTSTCMACHEAVETDKPE